MFKLRQTSKILSPSINYIINRCSHKNTTEEYIKELYPYFKYSVRINVMAGSGENGRIDGNRKIGGNGGNVYVKAVKDFTMNERKYFVAENGKNGVKGRDIIIKAPIGVTITNKCGRILGKLNDCGDIMFVALGGKGGYKFNKYRGREGEEKRIFLYWK